MPTVFLAPDPINSTQLIPGGNTPASGGLLFCYAAGSSTKQDMYVDNTGVSKWTNPIVLDSGGNLGGSNEVWIPAGLPAKFVLAPSNDTDPPTSPYWTRDNLSGINDPSSFTEWVSFGQTPTFLNATSFILSGDQTPTFTRERRLKTQNTAGTIYSLILDSVFTTSTTISVTSDSGGLDSGISNVSYGLISWISAPAHNYIGSNYATGNYIRVMGVDSGSSATVRPVIRATGPDTDIYIDYYTKGQGSHVFRGFDGGTHSGVISSRLGATNFWEIRSQVSGSGPTLHVQGSPDVNIDGEYWTQGQGFHKFRGFDGATNGLFVAFETSTTVNYLQVSPSTTGASPHVQAKGTDASVSINLTPQGSGGVNISTGILTVNDVRPTVANSNNVDLGTATAVFRDIHIGRNTNWTNQTTAVGASTATLTNSPHSGNPSIWPRININGTTFCFPCFLTT